jgi:hypothetical protein
MEEDNEDYLIMYVENREIKETVWEAWDLLNDQEIVNKIILNSLLPKEIEKMRQNMNTLLNNKEENNNIIKEKFEKNGNFINNFYF